MTQQTFDHDGVDQRQQDAEIIEQQRRRAQKLREESEQALARFREEQRLKDLKRRFSYMLAAGLGMIGFVSFRLGWLDSTLAKINFFPSGVYADCSDPRNKHVRYCQPHEKAKDVEWRNIRKSGGKYIPFSLS